MNAYRKYIGILVVACLTSCDSYLNQVDPNNLSAGSLQKNESDMNLLLMGCYDGLQEANNFGANWRFLDCLTEIGNWDSSDDIVVSDGNATPETSFFEQYWSAGYLLIARCNELLANLNDVEDENEIFNKMAAEALFLRALAYYRLTMLYKDVPLITDRQSFDERNVVKNTQEEIKAQILQDLDYAIEYLPADPAYPRASLGAALTLKAQVHQYFGETDMVLDLTKKVLDLNKYSLYPDYEKLFTSEADGNSEAIFAVAFESGIGEGENFSGSFPLVPFHFRIKPLPGYADSFYCTDGLPITHSPLYDPDKFYENRDPRYEVCILRQGETWSNGQPWSREKSITGYCIQKYVRKTTLNRNDGPIDYMVFRYADVLLMRAEALIESNNLTQEAYDLINTVRARVGMPSVESVEGTDLSQEKLREILRHERLVEFGEEGTRWFDLKRWGTVEEVYQTITYRPRPFLGEKTLYWPVPQSEIDNNPNLEQHSFWK